MLVAAAHLCSTPDIAPKVYDAADHGSCLSRVVEFVNKFPIPPEFPNGTPRKHCSQLSHSKLLKSQ